MGLLDVAIAADLLGELRELTASAMAVVVELAQDLLDQALVVGDQLALDPALGRVAEGVEARAAQALQPRQQAGRRVSIQGP